MSALPALTLMLQTTQIPLADAETVGVDSLAAAAAAPPLPPGNDFSVIELILHASLPVQLVMLLLLAASLASWVIIFRKQRLLGRASKEAEQFEQRFWYGAELGALYKTTSANKRKIEGLEAVFEAGFREYLRQRKRHGTAPSRTQLESTQRGMRVVSTRELDGLERNLEFLANVGSIAPYVGLLGTVWGIMMSFHGLANVREATIATVAPGISEALIATAMGLFAAIPAVWAYNRFATRVERLAGRYDSFADEFVSILESQGQDADE